MVETPKVYCFPDTNIFLHYRPFTDIKWSDELKAVEVCLVVAAPVFRELDKFKEDRTNPRRRDRARAAVRDMLALGEQELTRGVRVRDHVTLRVLADDPNMQRFARLQAHVPDDQLLASALAFAEACDGSVMVATGDGILRIKAGSHGLPTFDPAHLKLPDEKDDATKKSEQLQREIERLRQKEPQLGIVFSGQSAEPTMRHIVRHAVTVPTAADIEAQVLWEAVRIGCILDEREAGTNDDGAEGGEGARDTLVIDVQKLGSAEYMQKIRAASGRSRVAAMYVAPDYQQRARAHVSAYRSFVKNAVTYADHHSRAYRIDLSALNTGSCSAERVFISVTVPDTFTLLPLRDLPDLPIAPRRPMPNVNRLMESILWSTPPILRPLFGPPAGTAQRPTGPFFDQRNPRQVTYGFDHLLHGVPLELKPFLCIFPRDWNKDKPVPLTCHLRAGNMLDGINQRLEIIVDDIVELSVWAYLTEQQASAPAGSGPGSSPR